MTPQQLQDSLANFPMGEELIVRLKSTGRDVRGPYQGILDDSVMIGAGRGTAIVPAAEIATLLAETETEGPE